MTILNPNISFEDKFQGILDCHNNQALTPLMRQLPLGILWRIWKSRNLLLYQKKGGQWNQYLQKAIREANEWTNHWCEGTTSQSIISSSSTTILAYTKVTYEWK